MDMFPRKTPDVAIEGKILKRNRCSTRTCHYEIIRFAPLTKSNKFEFSVKLYEVYWGYSFLVGILEKKHPLKIKDTHVYFGQHGGKGYGWEGGFRRVCHHPSIHTDYVTSETFGLNDEVTLVVDKFEKKIIFKKNDKEVGELTVNDFAEEYYMGVSFATHTKSKSRCDFELIHFRDIEYEESGKMEEDKKKELMKRKEEEKEKLRKKEEEELLLAEKRKLEEVEKLRRIEHEEKLAEENKKREDKEFLEKIRKIANEEIIPKVCEENKKLRTELMEIKDEVKQKDIKFEAFRNAVKNDNRKDINELRNEAKKKDIKFEALKKEIVQVKKDEDELKWGYDQVKKDLIQVKNDYISLKKNISNDHISLKKDNNALRIEAKQKDAKFEALEHEVKQKDVELKALRKDFAALVEKYVSHIKEHHTLKYEFRGVQWFSDMTENSCIHGDEIEGEFKFVCIGHENTLISELETAKIYQNGKLVEASKTLPRSLEYKIKFSETGKNEFKIEFKNIKESFIINVGSAKFCQEKCEIILNTKEEDDVKKFSLGEEVETTICIKNENGTPLPFKAVQKDLPQLSLKISPKGVKKAVFGLMVDIEEEIYSSLENGTFELGRIKLGKKFSSGEYEIIVFDEEDFKIRRYFSLTD